jgi:hypothetical protein
MQPRKYARQPWRGECIDGGLALAWVPCHFCWAHAIRTVMDQGS